MLRKINWKFRKTHIEITLLSFLINGRWEGWGFDILNVKHNLWEGSLLKMVWDLPNGAEKKLKFTGDVFFLRNKLLKELSDLEDSILWNSKLSKWDEFKFWILNLIFD